MLEVSDNVFERLGLQSVADLTDSFTAQARSYQVQDLRGRGLTGPLLLKIFDKGATGGGGSSAIWDTGRWSTRSMDLWTTGKHDKGKASSNDSSSAAGLQNLQLNWLISEQAGHQFFPPIFEVGQLDGLSYLLRVHQAQSLATLARTRVVPNPAMLHHLISGVWTALCFLHQQEVNTPHGNLKLSNVLVGKGPVHEAPVFLCDAVETPETERKARKRDDFRALGLMIYQLAFTDPAPVPFVEGMVRADGADWSALGREGEKWKQLAVRLLDESSYENFNPLSARQDWLEPIRPKKARIIPIPLPVPASPAGPMLGGDAQAKPPQQICADIDERIQAGDLVAALGIGLKAFSGQAETDSDILSRVDYCAANLPADALADSANLLMLEEAANHGSAPAASRLGHALVKINPDEALSWLTLTVERGLHDALPALARLLEEGTSAKPADPARALACMEAFREAQPGEESDYLLSAMILRGKTGRPAEEAVRLLESLHERGHYRSTDLLAQCHATGTGTGIDEKKSYSLFAEAWNRSKSVNQHYYTASNNLGVCFATGFGVSRDLESAKHYFRQGAINKHRPSEENLDRLQRAAH